MGRVVSVHGNRPPLQPGLELGRPVVDAWVGLSDTLNGNAAVFAGPCNDNSEFTITGVPPGVYTLTMWDFPLDQIIDYRTVVVTADNAVNGNVLDFGNIPIFRWFGWFSGYVFADANRNGFRDRNPVTGDWLEAGVQSQTITLRFRDGALYKFTTTDPTGYYEFTEVFPWYKWIVAERSSSDTGKRTGSTIWVDNGGRFPVNYDPPVPVNFADPSTWYNDILTPQPQPENGGKGYRTELGDRQHEGHVPLHGGHDLGRLGEDQLRPRRERRDFGQRVLPGDAHRGQPGPGRPDVVGDRHSPREAQPVRGHGPGRDPGRSRPSGPRSRRGGTTTSQPGAWTMSAGPSRSLPTSIARRSSGRGSRCARGCSTGCFPSTTCETGPTSSR